MPMVQMNVWSGTSLENKKRIVEGITKVLEEIGVPKDANSHNNWYMRSTPYPKELSTQKETKTHETLEKTALSANHSQPYSYPN